MCTASWLRSGSTLTLHFNRDELLRRAPAQPPAAGEVAGVRFLAPIDGEAGGSWIGVNELGVALCLLNRNSSSTSDRREHATDREAGAAPDPARRSRGLLLRELLDCATPRALAPRLAALDLAIYSPFTLAALAVDAPAIASSWSGTELSWREIPDHQPLLCSSALDDGRADRERRAAFRRLRQEHGSLDGDLLEAFHRSHLPRPHAFSVCMHRADAETVSFSRVWISPTAVRLDYAPGPPCRNHPAHSAELARRR